MDDPERPAQAAPQEWLDIIEASEAEVAAGHTIPWTVLRAELMELINEQQGQAATRKA